MQNIHTVTSSLRPKGSADEFSSCFLCTYHIPVPSAAASQHSRGRSAESKGDGLRLCGKRPQKVKKHERKNQEQRCVYVWKKRWEKGKRVRGMKERMKTA